MQKMIFISEKQYYLVLKTYDKIIKEEMKKPLKKRQLLKGQSNPENIPFKAGQLDYNFN